MSEETTPATGGYEVRTELAGNVFKILVAVGDTVSRGEQVVILESMKMEIPVITRKSGTVTAVNTTQDAVVSERDVLVVLDVSDPA